ncbi:MAG: SIS domain-containing protein [Bacteroidota bacterium]|nr:SIS domain-containing protein [Bacteroidota bacterium]
MLQLKDLNLAREYSGVRGAKHTASEIAGQPKLWKEVYKLVLEKKKSLEEFLSPILILKDVRIILTGAGSSAFIGESVQGILQAETQRVVQAIPTTDLVTHPELFFLKEVPTLLISFARSGNSPESLESIRLANIYSQRIFHLIITCNENGRLIKKSNFKNYYTLILPDCANDKGLAMTGSFTSMLLSVMLIAKLSNISNLQPQLQDAIMNAKKILSKYLPVIKNVARNKYERVIFLGSGPLLGIARECQLKLQELTDGRVICKHDSFLGFRHGPRVVINKRSLIVYFFSSDDHVFRYEKDLVKEIATGSTYLPAICVGRKVAGLENSILDIEFENSTLSSNDFYIIPAVLTGQLLGFYKSIELGLMPDNPSVSGAINREVQGVTIYETANILE